MTLEEFAIKSKAFELNFNWQQISTPRQWCYAYGSDGLETLAFLSNDEFRMFLLFIHEATK